MSVAASEVTLTRSPDLLPLGTAIVLTVCGKVQPETAEESIVLVVGFVLVLGS